ncbi:MAG: hypothetical protein WDA20_07335 [Desulfuromonadales bacterium]
MTMIMPVSSCDRNGLKKKKGRPESPAAIFHRSQMKKPRESRNRSAHGWLLSVLFPLTSTGLYPRQTAENKSRAKRKSQKRWRRRGTLPLRDERLRIFSRSAEKWQEGKSRSNCRIAYTVPVGDD